MAFNSISAPLGIVSPVKFAEVAEVSLPECPRERKRERESEGDRVIFKCAFYLALSEKKFRVCEIFITGDGGTLAGRLFRT